MRRCLFAVGLMLLALPSWALTEIQSLEKRLIVEGESVELIGALTMQYALVGDESSAQAYWEYWQSMVAALPEHQQKKWHGLQAQLKQVLKNLTQLKTPDEFSLKYVTLFSLGVDTNANLGTDQSKLDMSFDSGERLLINIDNEAQSTQSTFTSVRWLAVQQTPWDGLNLSHGLEHIHYANNVDPYSLLRTGAEFEHGALTAFHYNKNDSITGIMASVNYGGVRGSYRYQTDRYVQQLGLQHNWNNNGRLHSIFIDGEYDYARKFRSGGDAKRARLQYQFQQQNWKLGYQAEYSKDTETYNNFLFPGVKDHYLRQTFNAERTLGRFASMNWSVRFRYDQKDAGIDLNDWNSFSLELIAWY